MCRGGFLTAEDAEGEHGECPSSCGARFGALLNLSWRPVTRRRFFRLKLGHLVGRLERCAATDLRRWFGLRIFLDAAMRREFECAQANDARGEIN